MLKEDKLDAYLDAGAVEESIGYKLRLAQILAFRGFELELSGYGRAPRYLGLLSVIRSHPGQPQSRLAEAIALKRSSLVPILDLLTKEGLVERKPSEQDRRTNCIWLTRKGEQTVEKLIEEAERYDANMTRGMSDEEVKTTLKLLQKLIDNLS